jgi:hypothetical protein
VCADELVCAASGCEEVLVSCGIRHVRRLGNGTATATHEALDSIAALLDAGLVIFSTGDAYTLVMRRAQCAVHIVYVWRVEVEACTCAKSSA